MGKTNDMSTRRHTFLRLLAVVSVLATISWESTAMAGGVEFPAAGTSALGRGGAAHARPGNPMSLLYNPAALASISGIQISLQTHLAIFSSCMQRDGNYSMDLSLASDNAFTAASGEAGDEASLADMRLPEMCNSAFPGVIPELVLSWRVHEKVGLAIGFLAPPGVANQQYGESTTLANGRTYVGTQDGLPAPTRYMLVESSALLAFPTIGLGVAVHPRVHLGLAFGSGFGVFDLSSVTRATGGDDFSGDVLTQVSVSDAFVPRLTASVHTIPHDNLDISLTFMWTDDVRAKGDVNLQSGYYQDEVLAELTIPNATFEIPQPWSLALGIRYAQRLAPRSRATNLSQLSGQVEDEMSNERWDIELDVVYERNSGFNNLTTQLPPCSAPNCGSQFQNGDPGNRWGLPIPLLGPTISPSLPETTRLPHRFKDQLSLRLGGDYNIIPGFVSARAGLSYETKGVEGGFEQIDFQPFQRFGLHVGATMRFGNFDLSLAYAHLFQSSATNTDGQIFQTNAAHALGELGAVDEPPALLQQRQVQNNGTIRSNFNVFSLGLTYHIR
ncbi:MAG: long-subunit fatty acid transport protein [Polyangiales bacterium]